MLIEKPTKSSTPRPPSSAVTIPQFSTQPSTPPANVACLNAKPHAQRAILDTGAGALFRPTSVPALPGDLSTGNTEVTVAGGGTAIGKVFKSGEVELGTTCDTLIPVLRLPLSFLKLGDDTFLADLTVTQQAVIRDFVTQSTNYTVFQVDGSPCVSNEDALRLRRLLSLNPPALSASTTISLSVQFLGQSVPGFDFWLAKRTDLLPLFKDPPILDCNWLFARWNSSATVQAFVKSMRKKKLV